jgi:hypothetical protein
MLVEQRDDRTRLLSIFTLSLSDITVQDGFTSDRKAAALSEECDRSDGRSG